MRKFVFYISLLCVICRCSVASAQSFSVVHDTMYITTSATTTSVDTVSNITPSHINMEWKVIATDFPPDWQVHTGICDPTACYVLNVISPTGVQTATYPVGIDVISCNTDLTSCAPGCYYVTARLENTAAPTDTAYVTWMVCKPGPSAISSQTAGSELRLYPSPAGSYLQVECNGLQDVRTIEVYAMTGKKILSAAATGATTSLNLTDVPAGVYLLRVLGRDGNIVSMQKLVKQ